MNYTLTKFDHFYMGVANNASLMSHAIRAKVGAVIANGHHLIDYGYNGMPEGMDNECEDRIFASEFEIQRLGTGFRDEFPFFHQGMGNYYKLVTKPEVLHAEENAILKIAKTGGKADGASIYCTLSPCIRCARMIHRVGIKKVFYNKIHDQHGIDFLKARGIETIKM